MKSKILLLANRYGVSSSANGVCTVNIANELIELGYEVWVISDFLPNEKMEEIINNVNVIKVNAAWSKRVMKEIEDSSHNGKKLFLSVLFTIKKIVSIIWYPNISPIRSNRVFKLACEIIDRESIGTVISFYRPYDTIKAGIKIKRKYGDSIKFVTDHLDLMMVHDNSNYLIKTIKDLKARNAIDEEFNTADRVIIPTSGRQFVENRKYKNLYFADFPLYTEPHNRKKADFTFDNNYYNITYIGSLDYYNRNPSHLLEILKIVSEKANRRIRFHIWGYLADKKVKEMIMDNDIVDYHGFVDNIYVYDILEESDILVNISNKITSSMVPSKIFQQFKTGKPIINYAFTKDDVSLPYFEKYGNALSIFEDCDICNVAMQVFDLLRNGKCIDPCQIDKLFEMSTPEYTARCILD